MGPTRELRSILDLDKLGMGHSSSFLPRLCPIVSMVGDHLPSA